MVAQFEVTDGPFRRVDHPLFGASDGPWEARSFDFERVSCPVCQTLLLTP